MIVHINGDLQPRLTERIEKIKSFSNKKTKSTLVPQHLVNAVLKKYLNRKDAQEQGGYTINKGVEWFNFKKENFKFIYKREGGECFYCQQPLSKRQATLDHKIPPLRGGLNQLGNVCLSCKWCNCDKSFLTAEEYFYKQMVNTSKGIKPPRP